MQRTTILCNCEKSHTRCTECKVGSVTKVGKRRVRALFGAAPLVSRILDEGKAQRHAAQRRSGQQSEEVRSELTHGFLLFWMSRPGRQRGERGRPGSVWRRNNITPDFSQMRKPAHVLHFMQLTFVLALAPRANGEAPIARAGLKPARCLSARHGAP